MMNIYTARIFIPSPTGYTLKSRTYGIRVLGYDKLMYDFGLDVGRVDDARIYGDFYKVVSFCYGVDLSNVPTLYPYVKYVDYMKAHGGIAENDEVSVRRLLKECNTLIVADDGEREFLHHLYSNANARHQGGYMTKYGKHWPDRFNTIRNVDVRKVLDQLGHAKAR